MAARLRSVLSLAGIPQEGFPVKVCCVVLIYDIYTCTVLVRLRLKDARDLSSKQFVLKFNGGTVLRVLLLRGHHASVTALSLNQHVSLVLVCA